MLLAHCGFDRLWILLQASDPLSELVPAFGEAFHVALERQAILTAMPMSDNAPRSEQQREHKVG